MKRIWKIARWPIFIIAGLFILLLIFNAAVIKYVINNYSKEYTGRYITVSDVGFNLFSGYIRLKGLNIKEADDNTDFVDIKRVELDLSIYKVWGGDLQLTSFDLIEPRINLVQTGSSFNFDDLIERFTSDTATVDTLPDEEIWYELTDLNVENAHLYYISDLLEEDLIVEQININVDTIASYRSLINAELNMHMDWGGDIATSLLVDQDNGTYRTNIKSKGTKLSALRSYVTPYMNIGEFNGDLNSDLTLSGSFDDHLGIAMNGSIGVENFEMKDPDDNLLTSVELCAVNIDSINVREELYDFHSITVEAPYLFFELYEDTDNFSKLNAYDSSEVSAEVLELGYDPSNPFSLMAHYSKEVFNSYQDGSFRLDSADLSRGHVVYNDYSLLDVFEYDLSDIEIVSHDINSNEKEFEVDATATLNTEGSLIAEFRFDPHTTRNMKIDYTIEDVVMPNFGPYSIYYTALPILSGRSKYTCSTVIADNKINSSNKIFIEEFNYGKKKKKINNLYDLPLKFAVSLLKDVNGNIDLEIPIEGDLDDPDYKIGKIVWKVLKNLITKATAAPYKALARTFDADEEDLKNVHFLYLQQEMTSQQKRPLGLIAKVINSKPEMKVELVQSGNKELEMNKYAVFMAKAKYLEDRDGILIDLKNPDLHDAVLEIKSRDSLFVQFLDDQLGQEFISIPVQKKCVQLIGTEAMTVGVDQNWALRKELVDSYLKVDKEVPQTNYIVRDILPSDTLISAGPPHFKVIYSVNNSE